ncbi:hypothetical protein ANCCAN_24179 [Ancylostoma caninum]|uniref:Piezo TM1-24 domain-containing protein n=1 Tax=Ancylostoma caninum TaxID=29170 RepID=A0A368FER5_ANCCA|nr:hypothetical protein ANCCAN_24179 [Ancylostoma caninum]
MCLLYCFLTTVAMSAYQIYEAVGGRTEKEYIQHCNDSDLRWMRYSGLIRFHGGAGFESTKAILPEIVAFLASLSSAIVVAVMSHRREELDVVGPVRPFLLFFAALHILAIYVYQIPVVQQSLPGESIIARIVGLSPIVLTDCKSWYTFWLNTNLQLPAILNPGILLIFYHLLVVQLLWTYKGSRNYVDDNDSGSSVHEEDLFILADFEPFMSIPKLEYFSPIVCF